MNTPLISVIVPVFNMEQYLKQCLDSVTMQTFENIEIICIDDGSTDNSPAILAEYAARDSRIIIHTQPNAGLSAARNAGLRMARGEWITGLDSDDWLEKDAYEYFYKNLPLDGTKLAVVGLDCIEHETGKVLWKARIPAKGLVKMEPSVLQIDAWFPNKFWHRSLVCDGDVRFQEGVWFEDIPFWHMIAPYQSHILFLPEVKYHYRRAQKGNSIINQSATRDTRSNSLVLNSEAVLKYRLKHPLPDNMVSTDLWMLENSYSNYIQRFNIYAEEEMWKKFRELIQAFNLEEKIYSSPKLALTYSLLPSAVDSISKLYATKRELAAARNSLENELFIMANGEELDKMYRAALIKYYFSFGSRRKENKKRVRALRLARARYRQVKEAAREKLLRTLS
ncbi:MAG: glycosyltransferase family 2 protein [Akkermansia sp.]|nr:glycosyltransferase family 2 protein [Akkermansia sp.]